MIAMIIAVYARKPKERNVSPKSPSFDAKGRAALYALPVARSEMEPVSLKSLSNEPPKKLPIPMPKVVSARPVTF